jgi:hypothetical protein
MGAEVKNLKGENVGGRRSRRQGSHHPWQVRSKWLALLLFGAAIAVTWQFARQQPSSSLSQLSPEKPKSVLPRSQRDDSPAQAPASDSKPRANDDRRLIYPYSVVRGGVANADELKHAMEYDPVVSRHFQGFDYPHAHLVRVSEKQTMYVSYRIGDRVYWTRRKVALHVGETLITDGKIMARTRCGNRVAAAPLDAGSPLEPSPDELEQPMIVRDFVAPPPALTALSSAPAKLPAAIVPPASGGPWWFIPPIYIPPSSSSSGGPLAVTPEPGSVLLILSGLGAVYWRSRKTRRNK